MTSNPILNSTRNNNIQFLRLFFALLVWICHSYAICYSSEPWIGSSYSIATFAVFGFFSISGYLITASYLNLNSLSKFFVNRFLRIFPALFLSVILGLFLALLTIPNLKFNTDFLNSLLNYFFGNVSLLDLSSNQINGAFLENRIHIVNASLWTLPLEFRLYIFVAFLGFIGILDKRVLLVLFLLFCVSNFASLKSTLLLNIVEPSPGQSVYSVLFFFSGMFIKLFNIRMNLIYFFTCLLISLYSIFYKKIPELLEIQCTAYVVIFIGLRFNFYKSFFNKIGDYSYGIYVYAFPIQQFVWYFMSHYYGFSLTPLQLIFLSGLFLIPVSILSWHFIEIRFLNLRDKIFN